jgi:uncharacterized membrane protein
VPGTESAHRASRWAARGNRPEPLSTAPLAPRVLGTAFAVSGTLHLVRPRAFETIMPRVLPQASHRLLIFGSGMAELALSTGLVRHRTWARWPSVLLLLAVFPANVQMAVDAGRGAGAAGSRVVAWGRLPFQGVLIWAALQ